MSRRCTSNRFSFLASVGIVFVAGAWSAGVLLAQQPSGRLARAVADAKALGRNSAEIGTMPESFLILDEASFLREWSIVRVKGSLRTSQTTTPDFIATWRLLPVEETIAEGKPAAATSLCGQFGWTGEPIDAKTLAVGARGGRTILDGVTITDSGRESLLSFGEGDYLLFGEICPGRVFRIGYEGAEAYRIVGKDTIGPAVLTEREPMNRFIRGLGTVAALKRFLANSGRPAHTDFVPGTSVLQNSASVRNQARARAPRLPPAPRARDSRRH